MQLLSHLQHEPSSQVFPMTSIQKPLPKWHNNPSTTPLVQRRSSPTSQHTLSWLKEAFQAPVYYWLDIPGHIQRINRLIHCFPTLHNAKLLQLTQLALVSPSHKAICVSIYWCFIEGMYPVTQQTTTPTKVMSTWSLNTLKPFFVN